jgi:hypothetical protein
MPVSESLRARVVQLLLLDIDATLGPDHQAVVHESAMNVSSFADNLEWYRDKLVEDVQQYFHDDFVDTTWPACPRHSNHPLWLRGEFWYCERDGEAIAKLGELHTIWNRGNAG